MLQSLHNIRQFRGGMIRIIRGGLVEGLENNSGVAVVPSLLISWIKGSPTIVEALERDISEVETGASLLPPKKSRGAFRLILVKRSRSDAPLGPPDLGWLAPSPS